MHNVQHMNHPAAIPFSITNLLALSSGSCLESIYRSDKSHGRTLNHELYCAYVVQKEVILFFLCMQKNSEDYVIMALQSCCNDNCEEQTM